MATSTAGCRGSWFLRDDERSGSSPGDSPMGLRLPLDSVPWVAEKDYPWHATQGPDRNPDLPELPKEFPYRHLQIDAPSPRTAAVAPAARPKRGGREKQPRSDEDPTRRPAAGRIARRGSSAPRCASSRAMDGCTSSCRRWSDGRLSGSHRRHRNDRRRNWACRSSSKAKRRRAIRA